MKKIKPIKSKTLEASKETYDDLFADLNYYIKTKLKARGIHDLIFNVYIKKIENSDVLDIGCGLGRFSFFASKIAKNVTAIDMTANAINCAKKLQSALNIKNIDFILSTIEDFKINKKFDFILLSGTLEHLIDSDQFFKKITKLLKPSGVFITDSPSEFNFRGTFHASLWKLFDFPMTLSDVRIVTPKYIETLCSQYGLKTKKIIGTLYKRGWGDESIQDLKNRMPNVLYDVKEKIDKLNVNIDEYFEWLDEAGIYFNELLKTWADQKLISKISNNRNLQFNLDKTLILKNNLPLKSLTQYLEPDFSIDPFYSEHYPINILGGNLIYEIIKK
tara:strand:- start:282 stop:1277 length:996 start_codon:yes stop_codon:yes gene_type:complete